MENAVEKTDKSLLASVAIDGTAIKTIRETKKLTQLYVASVVGVTTDTISRWENNRYPTIRRDNAEKLAIALEVGLAEILRQEVAAAVAEAPLGESPRRNRRAIVCASFVLVLAAGIAFFFFNPSATTTAIRRVPRYAAPGEVIPVQIKVTRRDTGSRGFIIKERLPPGWRLVNAAPAAASGEPAAEEVKWLIPGGNDPVTVYYTVRISATAAVEQKADFAGKIIVQTGGISRTEAIGGDYNVVVGAYHWADVNGDRRIDDNEIMPAYYLTEEMKGLGLDWKGIEAIWSGKGYGWDPERKMFVVIK
jgi:transcriptional regulator with XRE-family HTH domain